MLKITSYGKDFKDNKVNLVSLLKELGNIEGIESIKTLYMYPEGISDELINFIKTNEKCSHYFDIPLQHINNKILKSMNRMSVILVKQKENLKNLKNSFKKLSSII